MHLSSYPCLVVSRFLLIAAVLLGQFSGGGVCCCWIRYCVGQFASPENERPSVRSEIKKPTCPKCLARLKKSQETGDEIAGARCPCVSHTWIAISNEFEIESRMHLDGGALNSTPELFSFWIGDLSYSAPLHQGVRDTDGGRWQARACIWRI